MCLYLLYKLVKIGNLYIGVFIWLGYTSAELKYVCFSLMFENNLSQMVRFRHLMSLKFNPNQFIDKIGCAYIWKCLWYTEVGGKLKWRNCFQKISFSTNCSACVTLVNIEASVLIDCLPSKIRCSVIKFVVLVVWYSI